MEKTKIIALASQKGGVGKSSNAIMIANYLAALGKSVLVIDTDYGNSATLSYLDDRYSMGGKGFARAVRKRNIGDNIIQTKRENVDILPSNDDIERLEVKDPDTLLNLFEAEADVLSVYDYIIIDTVAGYNGVTAAALKASDLILTPFRLSLFDLNGCTSLFNKVDQMGKYDCWWMFFNDISHFALKKKSMQYRYIKQCRQTFEHCLDIYIPQTIAVPGVVDNDVRITRRGNEKLYEAVRRLVGIVAGGEVPEAEAF